MSIPSLDCTTKLAIVFPKQNIINFMPTLEYFDSIKRFTDSLGERFTLN